MNDVKITGSFVQAYSICPRQVWLMSRQLTGNQAHDFLRIGKLLSGETYKRDKKEIHIDGGVIDVIRKKGNKLVIIETKKSSRSLNSGKMQLLFYLYSLKKKGIDAVGELRVPKEKKIVSVELTDENIPELEKVIAGIKLIIDGEKPPPRNRIPPCEQCSYAEFCWS